MNSHAQRVDPRAGRGRDTEGSGLVVAIGVFKLVKAALLITAGVFSLLAVRHGLASMVERAAQVLRLDESNRFFHASLARAAHVSPSHLAEIGLGTFFYALLFLIEGTGLVLRRKWAEWFTVGVTASFVPLEVYELVHRFTIARVVVIVLNLGILAYLLVRRLHDRAPKTQRAQRGQRGW